MRVLTKYVCFCLFTGVFPLSVRVRVPPFRQRGEDAVLHCQYDLEPPELYSVQWYKDNEEFFRYKPRSDPQKNLFRDIVGVKVDVSTDKRSQFVA